MGNLKETGKPKPAGQAAKKGRQQKGRKPSNVAVLEQMIEKFQAQINQEDFKATVGDYIRLMQLREELSDEEPKEIRVTWVEPVEQKPSNET